MLRGYHLKEELEKLWVSRIQDTTLIPRSLLRGGSLKTRQMFKNLFHAIRNRTGIDESNLKKYLANTSWFTLERAVRVFLGFAIGIYVARFLGPEKFGLLSYAISFTALFSSFATLGLDGILVKALVHEPYKKDILLGTVFRLKFLGALAAVLLIIFSLLLMPQESSASLLINITAFIFLFQSFNVIDLFFQSRILSKYVVFAQLIQVGVSASIKLFLVSLKAPLLWFACAVVMDSIVLAVGLSIVYLRHDFLKLVFSFDWKIARQLLASSFPLMLSEIAIAIYMRVDQIIIKTIFDNKTVGCYAVVVVICEAFYFIPLVIIRTFFPVILNNKKESAKLYYNNLQKLYDLMVIISFSIAFLITIAAEKIILLLFGLEFSAAIPVLKIYVWASVFVFLGAANERWLWIENLQKYAFYRTLGGCLLSVGLNLLLVPKLNIQGAAISALISFGFVTYISFVLFKPMRSHLKIVSRSFNIFAGLKRIFYQESLQ